MILVFKKSGGRRYCQDSRYEVIPELQDSSILIWSNKCADDHRKKKGNEVNQEMWNFDAGIFQANRTEGNQNNGVEQEQSECSFTPLKKREQTE